MHLNDASKLYNSLPPGSSATFTWNDGNTDVLIVAVGENYSIASMLNGDLFYNRQWSEEPGDRQVVLCGQQTWYPIRYLLPRRAGLEMLLKAGNWTELQTGYRWIAQ